MGGKLPSTVDLNLDLSQIENHPQYIELWKKLGKLEIKMVEKNEECKHNVGDVFYYEHPYRRPAGVCPALLHVLEFYVWRSVLGFPSWNSSDRKVYKLHCPDPKGTVWEMRKVD